MSELIVFACVTAAALYLIRRFFLPGKRDSGCSACPSSSDNCRQHPVDKPFEV